MRMLPAGRVTAPALRGLSRFADTRGVPPSREFWLDYDVIEAFCVAGLAGRASSTRGTYRSALYRLAEAMHGPAGQRATPFAGAKAPLPYSPAERAELAAVAAAQRGPAKRSSALALIVFGIGAGLRPGELVALRGGDVSRHGRQVMVQVSGPSARVVPVTSGYAGRAWELARRAGSDFVFRPDAEGGDPGAAEGDSAPGRAGDGAGLLIDDEVIDGEPAGDGGLQRLGLDHRGVPGVADSAAQVPGAVGQVAVPGQRLLVTA